MSQQLMPPDDFHDDLLLLIAQSSPHQLSISSILGPSIHLKSRFSFFSSTGSAFSRIISCFAIESSTNYACSNWSKTIQRPFGKTHLIVYFFSICLIIRSIYCIIAVALSDVIFMNNIFPLN